MSDITQERKAELKESFLKELRNDNEGLREHINAICDTYNKVAIVAKKHRELKQEIEGLIKRYQKLNSLVVDPSLVCVINDLQNLITKGRGDDGE